MEETRSASEAKPEVRPVSEAVLSILLGWMVPGLGHVLLGRRRRGLLFLVLVLACVLLGCQLHGNLYWFASDQPLTNLATLGSMGTGLPYFILKFFVGYAGEVTYRGYEYGTAFLLTGGLMNLLLLLDVWDIARGFKA